ncbi:MAG: hypothetical protein B6245_04100 [Desulfobacteraceae bacterium 4572_88]|nr:MAG: hypothetical protein B6245_04100 [Desulfobacteraceae bacterium 4572_88]
MKKIALLICFIFIAVPASAQKAMKVVYFDNYQPFSWFDEQQGMRGILIDVLNEIIGKRMKISLAHEGYPWARAQKMVRHGKADAFVTVPTPERRSYTNVSSEPVTVVNVGLFTKKGNPKMEQMRNIRGIADLKDFSLISYLGAGWAKKNFKGFEVEWADNLDVALKMLAKGRSDIFAQPAKVVLFNIKKQGYQDQIVQVPDVTLDSIDFKLCVGKESPHGKILPEFDDAMKGIRTDGTLEAIYAKYK